MIIFGLIRKTEPQDDDIDYDSLIFRVKLDDIIDMDNSKDLWTFFNTLIDGGVKKILVDMMDLKYIDSLGIGVLINAAKLIRNESGDIAIAGVPSEIEKIFNVINLQRAIKIFDTERDAVNFLWHG